MDAVSGGYDTEKAEGNPAQISLYSEREAELIRPRFQLVNEYENMFGDQKIFFSAQILRNYQWQLWSTTSS